MTRAAPPGSRIRPGRRAEIPVLQAIERDAAELFREVGRWNVAYASTRTAEEHESALQHGIHWVAADPDDRPDGFALGALVDGHLHLLELAVARAQGRRGIGTALLATVIDHARWRFDPAVTLTTERDVPWNGPFYARHGFVEVNPQVSESELRALLEDDIASGLERATRCAMAKVL